MSIIHSSWIPNFITAATPMGLRRKMFERNAKAGAKLQYFDIAQINERGKLVWIAWFYEQVITNQAIEELGDGDQK